MKRLLSSFSFSFSPSTILPLKKPKLLVIMGPTGCGKSKLSVDLAARFFPFSEIINSDKIQLYTGLDITTNKIPISHRLAVPHHLLGQFDPCSEFSPSRFRSAASSVVSDVASRRKLPVLVGGSNSFIYALLANRFDPSTDVFDEPNSVSSELRYHCCFIWVDVSLPVLKNYLSKRVDDMLDSGMFEELAGFFESEGFNSASRTGLWKAIGVPEFQRYFERFGAGRGDGDVSRKVAYEEAVKEIKANTWLLAERQIRKIRRLRDAGWRLRRVDATAAVAAAMGMVRAECSGGLCSTTSCEEIWEEQVVKPSVKIVNHFLLE